MRARLMANAIAAVAFAAIHLPGWWFQGRLSWPPAAVECATIAVFGLALGYCRRYAGSTWGSILVCMQSTTPSSN
jgi:membrane protease YdiL (CAAX protease family)